MSWDEAGLNSLNGVKVFSLEEARVKIGGVRAHMIRWQQRSTKNTYPVQGSATIFCAYRSIPAVMTGPDRWLPLRFRSKYRTRLTDGKNKIIKSGASRILLFTKNLFIPLRCRCACRFFYFSSFRSGAKTFESGRLGRHGSYWPDCDSSSKFLFCPSCEGSGE